jgi:hypothetical protein
MKLFDKNGVMIIPVPEKQASGNHEMLVIKKCYCQNGHSLINNRAKFNSYDGIVIGVKHNGKYGRIALSPIYGDKSRVSLDLELKEGDLLVLVCPECKVKFPVYSACSCGGELLVMFTSQAADFQNCVGVCNRVGCKHSEIKNEGQLMTLITGDSFI